MSETSYFYANFARKCIVFWKKLHRWKIYTTAGRDGRDKFQVWEWLRKEAEGKRKCEKIMRETFGKKNYITKNKVGEVRNMFKARVGMSEFAEVAGPENAAIQNLAALP